MNEEAAETTENAQTKDRDRGSKSETIKERYPDRWGPRCGHDRDRGTDRDITGKSNSKDEFLPLRFSRAGGSPEHKNAF